MGAVALLSLTHPHTQPTCTLISTAASSNLACPQPLLSRSPEGAIAQQGMPTVSLLGLLPAVDLVPARVQPDMT